MLYIDLSTARLVADKVLAAAEQSFCIEGLDIQVSASVGVSVAGGRDVEWRDLLNRADQLLYRAKKAGRGRHVTQVAHSDVEASAA